MYRCAFALFVCVWAAPACADCDHFKWSVAKERTWFASPAPLPAVGGSADVGAGYALTLDKGVKLPVTPERAPGQDTYAAVVAIPKLEAGLYQITLSDEAWIDVAQKNAIVKSSDFSGQRDCPGVRKTVRFDLAAGAATLQISNAKVNKITFAISPSK
jgi:hypothetical protein